MIQKLLSQSAFISIMAFFQPIHMLLLMISILVLVDFISGWWANAKKTGKSMFRAYKSHTAGRSIVKICLFAVTMMLCYGIEYIYLPGSTILSKSVGSLILLIEFSSIMENFAVITDMSVFLKIFGLLGTYFNRNKEIINSLDYKDKGEKENGEEASKEEENN